MAIIHVSIDCHQLFLRQNKKLLCIIASSLWLAASYSSSPELGLCVPWLECPGFTLWLTGYLLNNFHDFPVFNRNVIREIFQMKWIIGIHNRDEFVNGDRLIPLNVCFCSVPVRL